MSPPTAKTVAELVVEFLIAQGVDRVFGLQGGHIQPIWDWLARRGVRIVDVRDEGAAVHMAHAHAVLTGGVGIAMVTAGPGVTNCVTAMANAQLERVPVLLIGGCAPRAQDDLGPLQGIAHVEIMRPVTRTARTLRVADNVLRDLDKAYAAAAGDGGPPGPVYVEIPTDVLRETVPPKLVLPEWLATEAAAPHPARCGRRRTRGGDHRAGDASAGADRSRRARGESGTRALPRPHGRRLPRHAGEPQPRAGRPSVRRRRDARARDAGGRPRDRRRPQARLPDGLRIAGRAAARALHPHRGQLGGTAREPARRGRAVRASGARARRTGRRAAGTVAASRRRVDEVAARRARAPVVEVRGRARQRARRQGRPHASQPDLRGAARRRSSPTRSRSPTAATS